jgi:MFS family permease
VTSRRVVHMRRTQTDPTIAPLSRNHNYQLLWGSQALSAFGGNAAGIAFPLLVLAISHSPATVGFVLGTSAAASLLVGLPAGAFVDRWNRKKVMLGCEATGVIASLSLAVALWWGVASVAHMVAVAAVFGVCGAMFAPAEEACLPSLVPNEQLSTAVSMNAARGYLGGLSGTAVGGFLFAIGRSVPFSVDVLTRSMAFFALLFLRIPPRDVQPAPLSRLGHEVAAGLCWMWRHRPVRITGLFAVGLNMFFTAYFIIIIVLAQGRGVSSGEIGVMVAMTGVGGLLGALVAPYLYQRLSAYLSIIGVFWALTVLTPLAIFINNGYLIGVLFASMAFLAPTANTTIATYQLLLTPDELRGRMNSVMGVVIGTAGVAGPALGGFLLEMISDNQAVLLCAAGIGMVTVLGTISPTLRTFPRHAAAAEFRTTSQEYQQRVES